MRKYGDNLFRIGEVTKILGITRKTLLVYEEMGLLTPAVKDKNSGFRYYTADNITQIHSIRSLQSLGLSLKEVKEYYYDRGNIDRHLQRLSDLRSVLDKNIQLLQIRSAKQGDQLYTILSSHGRSISADSICARIRRRLPLSCVKHILRRLVPVICPQLPACSPCV